MLEFIYPAKIEEESGFYTVSFRDIPFAITDGKTYEEALEEAVDCLGEALAFCIVDDENIPSPSQPATGEVLIAPPALVAAKAALYIANKKAGLNKTNIAAKIHGPYKLKELVSHIPENYQKHKINWEKSVGKELW